MLCWNEMGQKREVISAKPATGRLFCRKQIYRTIDSISLASQVLKQHFSSNNINFFQLRKYDGVNVVGVVVLFHIVNSVAGCFCAIYESSPAGPACSTGKGCKEKLLHL